MIVVAVLLVASAPLYFARGIGVFDDSLYLKAGQLILDGLKPYRDFYDIKPPGIYYVSAAIAAVGGRGWLAPRIFLFAFAAVFQIAMVRWIHTHFGARAAMFGAVLNGLSYPLAQGYSLHTEPFGALAAFAACCVVLPDTRSIVRWGVAGALVGLAVLFKQTGVLYLAALGAFAVFDRQAGNAIPRLPLRLTALVGGFTAVLALAMTPFVAQGLARPLVDAVVTGAANRADFPFASLLAIGRTWILSPALIAFLGVAVVLCVAPGARRALDDRRLRVFGLFVCVGVFAIVPTLKQGGAGHYVQPGAFAFSVACALFLDAYLDTSGRLPRFVTGVAGAGMVAYLAAVCGVGAGMLRDDKIHADLMVQAQMRDTLDAHLEPKESVLCVSGPATARLYLMSGRHPVNRSLYFYPSNDWLFSVDDARRALFDGQVRAAVVEINPVDDRPVLTDAEIASLRSLYDIVPLGPQTPLRLIALFRQRRGDSSESAS